MATAMKTTDLFAMACRERMAVDVESLIGFHATPEIKNGGNTLVINARMADQQKGEVVSKTIEVDRQEAQIQLEADGEGDPHAPWVSTRSHGWVKVRFPEHQRYVKWFLAHQVNGTVEFYAFQTPAGWQPRGDGEVDRIAQKLGVGFSASRGDQIMIVPFPEKETMPFIDTNNL